MRIRTHVLAIGLFACTHAGGGQGELQKSSSASGSEQNEGAVAFQWKSGADTSSGSINATLPDGRSFQGTFLQMTSTTVADDYGPYYSTWAEPGWGASGPWYTGSMDEFATRYSGKLMAHLTGTDGTNMRCQFIARRPETGLAGGAEGDCQLSTKETIFDAKIQ
jgi:hypothetical protein